VMYYKISSTKPTTTTKWQSSAMSARQL